uniref:C2H2-type domain-containing protein n=1 Tax=Anopheles christyi TaxID=43041 RepID=A0A182K6D6_9DIPT
MSRKQYRWTPNIETSIGSNDSMPKTNVLAEAYSYVSYPYVQGVALPYRCSKCGKRFTDLELLDHHVQQHTAQNKPFKRCAIGKQFCHRKDLLRRQYCHTGIILYACSICSKGFIRRDHLQVHELTHRNKKCRRGSGKLAYKQEQQQQSDWLDSD